jgi:hypothetical protein
MRKAIVAVTLSAFFVACTSGDDQRDEARPATDMSKLEVQSTCNQDAYERAERPCGANLNVDCYDFSKADPTVTSWLCVAHPCAICATEKCTIEETVPGRVLCE